MRESQPAVKLHKYMFMGNIFRTNLMKNLLCFTNTKKKKKLDQTKMKVFYRFKCCRIIEVKFVSHVQC